MIFFVHRTKHNGRLLAGMMKQVPPDEAVTAVSMTASYMQYWLKVMKQCQKE